MVQDGRLYLRKVYEAYRAGRLEIAAIERDMDALERRTLSTEGGPTQEILEKFFEGGGFDPKQGVIREAIRESLPILASHGARVQLNEVFHKYEDNNATPLEKIAFTIGHIISH